MNVGEMQRMIAQQAVDHPEQRFGDLYNLLYHPEWLRTAHASVSKNAGSVTAGCDGITMAHFNRDLERQLETLVTELKARSFEPLPARRVHIPKQDGRMRLLGIPSVRDRIVQEALRMLLEPIFEGDFSPYSFGFRPNRSTMDAIKLIAWTATEQKKYFWVVEGDIRSYFDNVHHRKLMKLLRRRIADKRVLDLIWAFLRAGVMERKLFTSTNRGVPQGGIISPLLANIYLHELDQYMWDKYQGRPLAAKTKVRRQGGGNFVYVRYADDFVVLCNGRKDDALRIREELAEFLSTQLQVELSLEKTKITHVNDGFNFLGYRLQRRNTAKRTKATKLDIPPEAIRRFKEKISGITARHTHQDSVAAKIMALNRVISGWCHYYKYASHASTRFESLDHHVLWCMVRWLGRKHKISIPEAFARFRDGKTYRYEHLVLRMPSDYKSSRYTKRFMKPHAYLESGKQEREEPFLLDHVWTGLEDYPGIKDLRIAVLLRDDYTCQKCSRKLTSRTAHVHHRKPVHTYKDRRLAHTEDNLETVCKPCHLAIHGWA